MQNRLKELRSQRHLTLREMSEQIKMPTATISQYETGKREPKLETWQKLADYFNVSVPYLQGYVDEYIDIHDLTEYEQDAYNRIHITVSRTCYAKSTQKTAFLGQRLVSY